MARPPLSRRSLTRAVLPAIAAAALAGFGTLVVVTSQQGAVPFIDPPQGCVTPPPPNVGGAINLVNGQGAPVTEAAFAGKPTLVYFGFTHCPDICPTSMYLLKDVVNLLGPSGAGMQTALITLDPARDTPDVMGAYAATNGFPPGLIGLSGTQEQINQVIQHFAVTAIKDEPAGDGSYNVSHSSFLYILDGAWNLKGMATTIGKTPQEVADCVRASLGMAAEG